MRQLLLLCVASALLAGADAAPDVIAIDQLPPSLRSRLSQEIAGGTIVDIRVDERSGDPQYIVRYRNQGASALQTLRLGQTGKVLDSGLIASPDHPDGSIGTSGGATPQTMPPRPGDGPTPVVPPQGQANRPTTGTAATPGLQQRAPGEAPADGSAAPATGGAPLNPNGVPGVMQQERQPQRENPPFPTAGSQPRNAQGTDQPRKEDPPMPTDGSQPNTNQGTTPGKTPSGGTGTSSGGASR